MVVEDWRLTSLRTGFCTFCGKPIPYRAILLQTSQYHHHHRHGSMERKAVDGRECGPQSFVGFGPFILPACLHRSELR